MFLRNYDNYMVAIQFQNYGYIKDKIFVGNESVFGDGNANVKSTNGTVSSIKIAHPSSTSTAYALFPVSLSTYSICLGTGNGVITYDDFKLSGSAIDNTKLAVVSRKNVFDAETKRWKQTSAFGYTNSTESDITISEWGLYRNNTEAKNIAFSNSSKDCVLMFREVLAEPVTIAAGTTGTLTFTLEIPTNHP